MHYIAFITIDMLCPLLSIQASSFAICKSFTFVMAARPTPSNQLSVGLLLTVSHSIQNQCTLLTKHPSSMSFIFQSTSTSFHGVSCQHFFTHTFYASPVTFLTLYIFHLRRLFSIPSVFPPAHPHRRNLLYAG